VPPDKRNDLPVDSDPFLPTFVDRSSPLDFSSSSSKSEADRSHGPNSTMLGSSSIPDFLPLGSPFYPPPSLPRLGQLLLRFWTVCLRLSRPEYFLICSCFSLCRFRVPCVHFSISSCFFFVNFSPANSNGSFCFLGHRVHALTPTLFTGFCVCPCSSLIVRGRFSRRICPGQLPKDGISYFPGRSRPPSLPPSLSRFGFLLRRFEADWRSFSALSSSLD